MTKGYTASSTPKPAKAAPGSIITPAEFIAGDYAAKVAAGELGVMKFMNHIIAVACTDGVYTGTTRLGETVGLNPTDKLLIGPPWKQFVRNSGPPFGAPKSDGYQDAPGAFKPPIPGAPNPGNMRAVAVLCAVCERRTHMQKKLHMPERVSASPGTVRARLLEKIKEEAA